MAFINPGNMMSADPTQQQYNAGPSPNFFQRILGSMGGGQQPMPVGGPTGMQRFGGALGSALMAPGMSAQPNAGIGMSTMPIGPRVAGPMINPGQNGGGIDTNGGGIQSPLWQRYLQMIGQQRPQLGSGMPPPNSSGAPAFGGGGIPGGGMRNFSGGGMMKSAAY